MFRCCRVNFDLISCKAERVNRSLADYLIMKHFQHLVQFNSWANTRLLQLLDDVPSTDWDREIAGSFPGLRKTWYHIWDAESIWLQRLQGHSPNRWPSQDLSDGMDAFQPYLLQTSHALRDLVLHKEREWLDRHCLFQTMDGKSHRAWHSDIIQHVVNHGSYHRGQIVNFYRFLGLTAIPSTDYIRWTREQMENDGDADPLKAVYG